MNNVQLMGRISTNPELRYLSNSKNTAVIRFNLAVDRKYSKEKKQEAESKNQQTSDFINCQAFGKIAESIDKYTGKGLRVNIAKGHIQTGRYEKDGVTIYTTDVIVDEIEFLDWKDSNNSSNNFQNRNNSTNEDDFDYTEDFDPTEDKRIPF